MNRLSNTRQRGSIPGVPLSRAASTIYELLAVALLRPTRLAPLKLVQRDGFGNERGEASVHVRAPGQPVRILVETVTDSSKLIVMFVLTATCVAPFAGDVVVTAGGLSFGETKTGNSVDVHCEGSVTYRRTPVELEAQK